MEKSKLLFAPKWRQKVKMVWSEVEEAKELKTY